MSRALKIVMAGHVDHGKSTLIGRLLHDTDSLPPGKAEELKALSDKRGVPLEWSFVLDSLQTERDQAITIETTRVWFRWNGRRYVIIDAPGHREFVRNMLSGASEADAAVLVVDAIEGISEQTQRHAQLLQMLGIRQIVVVANKMDGVDYSAQRYEAVCSGARELLGSLGLEAQTIIPVSARNGENVATRSENMPWYDGPVLLDAMERFVPLAGAEDAPLRMRVQDVYREETTRIAAGRVESGRLQVGDTVLISPMGSKTTIRSIERWNSPQRNWAGAGESIGITFSDPVFINRGDVISHVANAPSLEYRFNATCFWLDDAPPVAGEQLTICFGPASARAVVTAIESVIDSASLEAVSAEHIPRYAIVQLKLRSSALVAVDDFAAMPLSSRLVMLRGRDVVAGGVVTRVSTGSQNIFSTDHLLTSRERERRNGHRGMVLWFTGLSGSGKSTLAMRLERRLFERGASVYVLDGDNIRKGLSSDLGFTPGDRAENIRRVGEVAALLTDAGMIVVTAFISPMHRDREIARAASPDHFHEVYVKADVATCEARDTKGLYKRARAGEIPDFTGVSAPYEAPEAPDLVVDTMDSTIEECVEALIHYVETASGLEEAGRTVVPARSGA